MLDALCMADSAALRPAVRLGQASSSFSQGQLVSSLKAREAEVAELTQQLEAAKKEASHHRAQLEAQHRDIGSYSRAVDRCSGGQPACLPTSLSHCLDQEPQALLTTPAWLQVAWCAIRAGGACGGAA